MLYFPKNTVKLLASLAISTILAASALAQQEGVTAEILSTGVTQPTALDLPVPAFPKEALKAYFGGRVTVAVTIDEQGKVISADDADGPYPVCRSATDHKVIAMRAAAIGAAERATFKPAISDSGPIPSIARIAYHFNGYPKPVDNPSDRVGVRVVGEDTETITGTTVGPATDTKNASGGVLNGKALSLPRPPFPPAAKAVRATGAVSVQVLIYEDGTIFSAQAISGHPLLRSAAENAACGSRFSPTLLQGNPVKVSGFITYNFVP